MKGYYAEEMDETSYMELLNALFMTHWEIDSFCL